MSIELEKLINPAVLRDYSKGLHGATAEDGTRWSLVTDGHMLLAVREDRGLADLGAAAKQLTHWDGAIELGAADLAGWLEGVAGEMPVVKTCEECAGKKRVDCECERCGLPHDAQCGCCGGDGTTAFEPLAVNGTIRGSLFNRRFFRRALDAGVPPTGMRLSLGPTDADPVRISGDGWFFVAMPIRKSVGEAPGPELLP